ncbi:hypothetical protein CBM2633_A50640 [Cupriavidus taiwanensis]|uniref:Uncharacterized protein n=1 Tax=Cupriavidus taiwanensis TaxID=164546 RepID=A0A375DWW3_9BURK|nr:hypothetical protein CBM2610_A80428 [Cupriavidus taiwanensis]SOZ50648.1 hypothetical protein CBM2615_A160033 [Cupriavidus taiwanensis]SOZ54517.1 hypothetical protein CBM2613_A160033 [Cupriavidus taiwanensis]SPA14908.1 hypothetical protein CBM2633_A50640 [Cupriavidus taiwanensis]
MWHVSVPHSPVVAKKRIVAATSEC